MATDPIPPTPESELGGSTETTTGATRRRFLQGAGIAAGALVLGGISAAGRGYAAPKATDAEPADLTGTTVATYPAFDADQGVAVDDKYFYSIDNYSITKHDKQTGEALLQWYGGAGGPIHHLDGGMVLGNKLYGAHSNYHEYPMASSIEVWDTRTMQHIDSYSFGIYRGSLTWIDRYDEAWWGTFANYDELREGTSVPYGETANTQMVKMDDNFQVVESWTYPTDLVQQFKPYSSSGGSWGPDGRLYVTGHDASATYVLELPNAGPALRWVATVQLPDIEGQGIAWDRSAGEPHLWGITADSRHVVEMKLPLQPGRPGNLPVGKVVGPGQFIEP